MMEMEKVIFAEKLHTKFLFLSFRIFLNPKKRWRSTCKRPCLSQNWCDALKSADTIYIKGSYRIPILVTNKYPWSNTTIQFTSDVRPQSRPRLQIIYWVPNNSTTLVKHNNPIHNWHKVDQHKKLHRFRGHVCKQFDRLHQTLQRIWMWNTWIKTNLFPVRLNLRR